MYLKQLSSKKYRNFVPPRAQKRFCLLLVFILSITFTANCLAHDDQKEHYKEIEAVLFEKGYSKYQSEDIKKYVTAIEYASALTIDQYGGSDEKMFDQLRAWGMGGLPLFFSTIDYSEDLSGNGKKINPNTHRYLTHQGWDQEGVRVLTKKESKFWNARRNILLGTLNSVFGFNALGFLFGYDSNEKCNSLAGIIYYVHILGDYNEADNYKKISLLIDLAGHENTDKNDMITWLKTYIEILFADQKKEEDYKELMKELDAIAKDAAIIVRSSGGVNTDEEFEKYDSYADQVMASLQNHVPKLLKQEEFFRKVFYPVS